VGKWLRLQSKDFYAAGSDVLVKRYDGKYMLFPGSNITFFYVLYPFVTYLLTLSRM
jgi:hypothetical protein